MAEWDGDKLTVWTGTQRPFGVRSELAASVRHCRGEGARDRARHRLGLRRQAQRRRGAGSGAPRQGRRQAGEAQLDARRGDDLGVFPARRGDRGRRRRPTPDGTITDWEFHNYNSGASGLQSPYDVAAQDASSFTRRKSPLRQGSYRGLAATANHFVRESYMDELAHSVKHGPARIPPEERQGRAAARRDRGGGRQVRLEGAQEDARAAASASPPASKRAATWPPAPKSASRRTAR